MSLASSLALLKPLLAVVALLLLMWAGVVSSGRWLLQNEEGARWLLGHLPGVQVTGWRGAWLDSQWSAQSLRVQWDNGRQWVLIEDLRLTGVAPVLRPHPQAWLALVADTLQAARVTVETGPRGPRPIPLPETLAWPLQLQVRQADVAELRVDALSPFTVLSLQGLALDPRPQARHMVQQGSAVWSGLQLSAGGGINNQRPYAVELQGTARPVRVEAAAPASAGAKAEPTAAASGTLNQPAWAAAVQLSGALSTLHLQGTLRGVPLASNNGAAAVAPAVDVRAGLRVLEDWPLDSLQLRTQDLDLQALQRAAPRTSLSGTADIAMRAQNAPISALVDLRNALPGRWDSGLVPLRQMRGEVVGSLAQRQRVDFNQLELLFGDAAGPAGRWTGSAVWQGHELKVQSQLQDLWPQRLDSRAAGMRLSGPFNATLLGLPSPDAAAATPTPGKTAAAPPPQQLSWDFDLEGLLDNAPQPVQLAVAGVASDGRLEIKRAQARTGGASADLSGTLLRLPASAGGSNKAKSAAAAGSEWRLQTGGTVKDFDPLPWWPGERNTVWHKGPHRLTAQWTLDLLLPPGAAQLPGAALVQRVAGNGTVQVRDSLLAGLPLTADITLGHQPGVNNNSSNNTPATVKAEIRAAGNVLTLDGRGDPTGEGLSDRWRAELKAEQLAALAPWAALHPALADWLPQQGQVNASITAEGRWPQLRTEGTARTTQLRVGAYLLKTGAADWRLDTASGGPLDLKLDLTGLQSSTPPVTAPAPATATTAVPPTKAEPLNADVHAEVRGTVQNHQIKLTGSMPAGLSPALAQLLGLRTENGSQLSLQAQGAWQPESNPSGAGHWRGTVERVLISAWDGKAGEALPAATWAEARNLRADLQLGAGGTLSSFKADAGRLLVGPAGPPQLALRWDDVQVDLRPDTPHLQLRAEVEPFDAVPLLTRLQPTMGWAGNLKLGAKLDMRATERMDLDLVLQRIDGDLNIESNDGLQLLGLTELRATLAAHDGLWQLTPLLKGRGVGEMTGAVQIRSTPGQRWPAHDAPLQGSITARATDIGIWAPWVPAGWRLTGDMNATATIGGTLGTPRYTGAVRGSNIGVRNLLQGVNVSGGDVSILLEGETARIERFTLKGGEGRIDITGDAVWSDAPVARLQLKAERFRALGRLDRMLITSGEATLKMQRDQGRLEGKFIIDEGLFDTTAADAPSLDSDVSIRGQEEETPTAVRNEPTPRKRNFALAVDVNLGDKLRVRGRGLDTTLHGDIRITNPEGRLAVNGAIQSVGGTYAAYGQKLDIERGVLTFTGPADNPRLDVLALRPNIDNRVGVLIAGQAQAPRVRLYAEPDMSDTDKLSWLVLGRAPDGLGRSDTALLQRAAVALLSGEGEAPTDALLKSLGIDEISLRQGDGDVRETVITLGKQLSRRWYVGYERGVNAASGTWQLIYRIAQRFTLRAQSGLENSLDVIWVWRVQETPADANMRKSIVTPK